MQVKNLESKEYLTMTTDPCDIEAFMSSLTKKEKDKMWGTIGTLWVDTRGGDYGEAWYCLSSVPWLTAPVYEV